jgi:hypothetical protein
MPSRGCRNHQRKAAFFRDFRPHVGFGAAEKLQLELIHAKKNRQNYAISIFSAGVIDMAKGEQRGNREAKKPKKEKPKTIAAAPSTKGTVPAKPSGAKH